MGTLHRLPGQTCRYFLRGRCLYEEMLNPGYREAWGCAALAEWERIYEEFVGRAESFGLTEEAAAKLMEQRFRREERLGVPCERYTQGEGDGPGGCVHSVGRVCLLQLPECPGRCPRFVAPKGPPHAGKSAD